jgi:aspartate/methionine/tyrosine aminotransferase
VLEAHHARWADRASRTLSAASPAPLGLRGLVELFDDEVRERWEDLPLGYATTRGLPVLREEIARRHSEAVPEDVLTFAGAQEALFCAFFALLSPGDRVVTFTPGYEDLHALPAALGARVVAVGLRSERDWRPDLAEVEAALAEGCRLLVLSFPHNPTGATLAPDELRTLIGLADDVGARVLSDEVFRDLAPEPLPAATDLSERAVSVEVTGKSLGLGGIRVGWAVCRDREALGRMEGTKTRLSICNGATDEVLALAALRAARRILDRHLGVIGANLGLLGTFFEENRDRIAWVPPRAGCVGFPEVRGRDVEDLVGTMAREEGILLCPARLFGSSENRFRLGFARPDLPDLLPALARRL